MTSEIQEEKSNGTEINGKAFPKISMYIVGMFLISETPENFVPFVTGNIRQFNPGLFYRIESAHCYLISLAELSP